ncbi:MAG: dihydrofolate reductase [Acidobacteria bacterium]|nr:MAG: dihydrofolate reductase [Acidobacteriota bacterium]
MIIGIVAISKNFAIGKDGKLPWHYSADLKFFKQTTTGNAIVMGWNTWKSIGKPLPNRLNIVLTRKREIEDHPDVRVMRSKEEVLELAAALDSDVFIIGGSQAFEAFADEMDKWLVTEVPITVDDADTFMPRNFLDNFELVDRIDLDEELSVNVFQRQ